MFSENVNESIFQKHKLPPHFSTRFVQTQGLCFETQCGLELRVWKKIAPKKFGKNEEILREFFVCFFGRGFGVFFERNVPKCALSAKNKQQHFSFCPWASKNSEQISTALLYYCANDLRTFTTTAKTIGGTD